MAFFSNVQSINSKGEVANRRQEHTTRHAAYERVLKAKNASGKPKSTICYANRQYTVVL